MRVLMTGCAGFIGSHLTEQLLGLGHEVVGIDAFTDYYDRDQKESNLAIARDHERFTLIEDNLTTMDLHTLVPGIDLVYHQAAQPGVRASWGHNFETYARNNILATQRLLEVFKGTESDTGTTLRKFVYASSSSIYGDAEGFPTSERAIPQPVSPYGVSKLGGEQLVYLYWRNYGVPTVSLRYFTVYGPRQRPDMAFHRFIRRAMSGDEIPIFGDGNQTRDFTFIADAVEANVLAGLSDVTGQVFNIGGGSRVSVNDVLSMLTDILGRPLKLNHLANERGDVRHTSADTSQARALLGYAPHVDLREGLAKEAAWVEQRIAAASSSTPAIAVAA